MNIRMSAEEVDPFKFKVCRQESGVCTVLNIYSPLQEDPGNWRGMPGLRMSQRLQFLDATVQNGTETRFAPDTK